MCSGGGVTVGGCGVAGVSGGAMKDEGEGGGTGCGSDAVMSVDTEYEEVGAGVTCEYTVVGVAV